MVSTTDGSAVTTGTCNVAVEIDGVAGTGGTATHIANGKWEYAPIQADTNGDYLTFQFVLTGAVIATIQVYTTFPQTVDNNVLAAGATGFAAINTDVELILADTGELQTNQGNWLTATGFSTAAALATAQTDLDTITDTDGVILGAAGVDLIWDELIAGNAHNIQNSAGRRLRELRESGFYSDGFIYIDTVNGVDDSTDYEAGTEVNPVDSITNANLIAASLGLSKFKVSPGSSITLLASQQNQIFEGIGWTLILNNQNIDGSTILGANVSGVGINTTGEQYFIGCDMGATTLPGDTHLIGCAVSGTLTFGEDGNFFFDNCHSAIAGSGSPTVDFGSPATETNLSCRHHSGGWTVANMGAGAGTCNASFEGNGQITWAATCAATSNASVRGNWKITDLASGAVTVTLDDNQAGVDAIEVKTDPLTYDNTNNVHSSLKEVPSGVLSGTKPHDSP